MTNINGFIFKDFLQTLGSETKFSPVKNFNFVSLFASAKTSCFFSPGSLVPTTCTESFFSASKGVSTFLRSSILVQMIHIVHNQIGRSILPQFRENGCMFFGSVKHVLPGHYFLPVPAHFLLQGDVCRQLEMNNCQFC